MANSEIKMVVGSWGSYNACNARALGSEWICLNDFEEWEEIEDELKAEGFELDGIDQELFIQDIEGIDGFNCDNMHPKKLFNLLKEAEVLSDEYKYKKALALIEAFGWSDFEDLIEKYGDCWDDDIYFYEGQTLEDVAYDLIHDCYNLPEIAKRYFDYEAFARDLSFDGYTEVSNGVIEWR